MGSPRRALVIAYFFPPLGGAGVQRTLKFVKYLPEFGWNATVVSTRSRLYPSRDTELVREIPHGTRVVRAPALPVARYAAILLHKLGWMRLKEYVAWPDGGFGWAPTAFAAAWREVRRERPDVIYSTSAPYGGPPRRAGTAPPHRHSVGRRLPRRVGRRRSRHGPAAHARAPQPDRIERAIRRHAAHTVVVADYFRLASDGGPRTTITNGVDPEDVPEAEGSPPERSVPPHVCGHGLRHDRPRAGRGGAPADDRAPGRSRRSELELRIVGGIWLPGFSVPDGVPLTQTGYVGHDEAIAEMRRGDGVAALSAPVEPRSVRQDLRVSRRRAAGALRHSSGQPGRTARV